MKFPEITEKIIVAALKSAFWDRAGSVGERLQNMFNT